MKNNRKIHINESQYGLLSEAEWNFHVDTSGKEHDLKPYGSDSKYVMPGRETGHFGSGTYFSTYKGNDFAVKNGDLTNNFNPNFIKISDRIYRVDFDLYKNLYRVKSKQQGDVLYTMCTELNRMYNKISNGGNFSQRSANYSNSSNYQIIRHNAEALGLKCPSYYELVRMAQRHKGVQSFSTLFMEWNGFNGVNVSGIDFYDNTKHGSVIYDLSKVSDEMREVTTNMPVILRDRGYNNTVAYDEFRDHDMSALNGDYIWWVEKLNQMPMTQALRVLKNYTKSGNVLSPFRMGDLDDGLLRRYLGILYSACINHYDNFNGYGDYSDGPITLDNLFRENGISSMIMDYDKCKYYARLINKVGAYYWANYIGKNGKSMFTEMLWEFSSDLSWDLSSEAELAVKKEFLNKVMGSMKRELTKYEKEFLEEDYYG